MITIKCFGKVEISGEGKLPFIAIESTDEIRMMSENVEITDDNELTAFVDYIDKPKLEPVNYMAIIGITLDLLLNKQTELYKMGQFRRDINQLTGIEKPMTNIKLDDLKNDLFNYLINK